MGFETIKNLCEHSKRASKKVHSNLVDKVMLGQLDNLQEEGCVETLCCVHRR